METLSNTKIKPMVGDVYSYGWKVMERNFWPLLLVSIIVAIVSPNITIKPEDLQMPEIIAIIFGLAFALFVTNPINYGADYIFLKAVRNIKFEVKEIVDGFKKNYLNVVLAALLSGSIIVAGFILLVVPGIILACRLAFVPYLVMDKQLDPVKAVEESWRLTKGYGWTIFGMGLLAIPVVIAGILALLVGVLVSIVWISAAFAAMYQAVLEERGENERIVESLDNDLTE
ncbi:MAG: hypothetical protein ABFS35_02425 [Bacteroidota bacterium]